MAASPGFCMPEADIASSSPPLINSTGGVAHSRCGLALLHVIYIFFMHHVLCINLTTLHKSCISSHWLQRQRFSNFFVFSASDLKFSLQSSIAGHLSPSSSALHCLVAVWFGSVDSVL